MQRGRRGEREISVLRGLLAEVKQNLLSIRVRMSEYPLLEDVPISLIRNKRYWEAEIARLEEEIARLEAEAEMLAQQASIASASAAIPVKLVVPKHARTISVVGYMLVQQARKQQIVVTVLAVSAVAYLAIGFFWRSLDPALPIFLLIAALAFAINCAAVDYRARKGFYGTAPDEGREIIQFILEHTDDPNFPSDRSPIFPEAELAEWRREVLGGEGVRA